MDAAGRSAARTAGATATPEKDVKKIPGQPIAPALTLLAPLAADDAAAIVATTPAPAVAETMFVDVTPAPTTETPRSHRSSSSGSGGTNRTPLASATPNTTATPPTDPPPQNPRSATAGINIPETPMSVLAARPGPVQLAGAVAQRSIRRTSAGGGGGGGINSFTTPSPSAGGGGGGGGAAAAFLTSTGGAPTGPGASAAAVTPPLFELNSVTSAAERRYVHFKIIIIYAHHPTSFLDQL